MKFFVAYNNGVVAVISEDHAKLYGVCKRGIEDPREAARAALKAGVRIFTFASAERLECRLEDKYILTGTTELLDTLVHLCDHVLDDCGTDDWPGYVPFSNGYESESWDDETCKRELEYRTTLEDVLDAFGDRLAAVRAA
ncbi:MAG: hypothetical protein AAB783_01065 [Patescibacteria group bacterium]